MRLEEETITGLVIPASWSEEGRVTGVTIASLDESERLVAPFGVGLELTGLLHQMVEVHGLAVPDGRGGLWLEVSAFQVLGGPKAKPD